MIWLNVLSGGVAVAMENKRYYCPKHGDMFCPLCGSMLVKVEYAGNDSKMLALAKRDGFRGFLGCLRVDLHDKIVDGVNYRGKVFVKPILG